MLLREATALRNLLWRHREVERHDEGGPAAPTEKMTAIRMRLRLPRRFPRAISVPAPDEVLIRWGQ